MIHPGIRMVDLDPEGFAWLNAVVGRRSATPAETTLTVLHDGDQVVNAVRSDGAPAAGLRGAPLDAASLRERTGADRVVLLDRARLGDLAARVVDAARATNVQPELLVRAQELFWHHPAVRTDPAPSASPWGPVAHALRRMGNGTIAVRVRGVLDLVARVEHGLVVHVTSAGFDVPGHVCTLVVSKDVAERILGAARPLEELEAVLDAGAFDQAEGIAEVLWPAT